MAIDYLSRIDELRRAELVQRARSFAAHYDERLPTVLLLPGGMGSRLLRSTRRFDPREPQPPLEPLYELWLDLVPVLRAELACLAMDAYAEELDQHPIIAAGELSSVVNSYDGVFEFFRGRANVAGFGYDWRRAPEKECGYVGVYLELVAEALRQRNRKWRPQRDLTVYAHSQGGLVAKFFVERLLAEGKDPPAWFARLVTCCTPFYGTSSHISRYYTGEQLANLFTGGADEVSRIAASMEGPYILLPAPRDVIEPRLPALGLMRYPVRDRDSDAACDPHDGGAFVRGRWRPEISRAFLVRARNQFQVLDRPLPAAVASRVYHMRSDIHGGPAGQMSLELSWRQVNGAAYSADQGDPVQTNETQGGRGDGTVPFWSARLASTPDERVFDVYGVKHGGAAEHPAMLGILWRLMQGEPVPPGPHVAPPGPSAPSQARLLAIGDALNQSSDPNALYAGLQKHEQRAVTETLCLG
jgi:hypothetical protein